MDEILKIRNLSKNFGRKRVLEDFNIIIEKGKVYGFMGKNAEGKTTLIRIILGIIPADKGEIFYKSERIKYNDTFYKKEIGYIPEFPFFYNWMTVEKLLNFNSSFYPTWNARKVDDYLERFSLEKKMKIKHLSRGMKIKLGLLVALASEPELLILDDPTSGLDVPTRHDFLKDIIRDISEAGTTIFFSTHLVHEIEGIVDHLNILHHGKLILDEKYQKVKDYTKRILITFKNSIPDSFGIDGILDEKRSGNRAEIVIYPWNKKKEKRIEDFSPSQLKIEPLTLEEIFISFVSKD